MISGCQGHTDKIIYIKNKQGKAKYWALGTAIIYINNRVIDIKRHASNGQEAHDRRIWSGSP